MDILECLQLQHYSSGVRELNCCFPFPPNPVPVLITFPFPTQSNTLFTFFLTYIFTLTLIHLPIASNSKI